MTSLHKLRSRHLGAQGAKEKAALGRRGPLELAGWNTREEVVPPVGRASDGPVIRDGDIWEEDRCRRLVSGTPGRRREMPDPEMPAVVF